MPTTLPIVLVAVQIVALESARGSAMIIALQLKKNGANSLQLKVELSSIDFIVGEFGVGFVYKRHASPFLVNSMKIDVVKLEIKKSHQIEVDLDCETIYNVSYAAPLFQKEIGSLNVEHVAMLALDNADRIINYYVVSVGDISDVKVSLGQMFRNALLCNASKIIVAHNHPSGVLEITSKDIEMTRKIAFIASCFSIDLLDSFVVSAEGYKSIREYSKEPSNER